MRAFRLCLIAFGVCLACAQPSFSSDEEVPNWWGTFCNEARCVDIGNFRTGTFFNFTFSAGDKELQDGTAGILDEACRNASGGALPFTLEKSDDTVLVKLDPDAKPEPGEAELVGTYTRKE